MSRRGRHRRAGKPQGQSATGPAETGQQKPMTLLEWMAKSPNSLVTRQQLFMFVTASQAPLVRAMGLDRVEETPEDLKKEFEQGEAAENVAVDAGLPADATLHDRLDRESDHPPADPEE